VLSPGPAKRTRTTAARTAGSPIPEGDSLLLDSPQLLEAGDVPEMALFNDAPLPEAGGLPYGGDDDIEQYATCLC